jgi:hypothetical protein
LLQLLLLEKPGQGTGDQEVDYATPTEALAAVNFSIDNVSDVKMHI